jgi:acetylglutamate kinase
MLMRVIKVGGRVQSDPRLAGAIVAAWEAADGALCVVHGGGDEISTLQRALGIEPRFVGGRRVTSEADLDVLRMALSGSSNKRLVARLIDAGAPAIGISGEDAGLITADAVPEQALGRVGTPTAVRAALIDLLVRERFLPVISPVARGRDGPLNVNGDDAAAMVAAATGAAELILLADVPGVRDGSGVVPSLDPDGARGLIASGIADGGMAAKLEAAIRGSQLGVASIRIGDLSALTDPTAGTILTAAASLV